MPDITEYKLNAFTEKVADLADRPALTPAQLKAKFDAAVDELRLKYNLALDYLYANYPTTTNITTDRKLSATGDFTGTLNGLPITAVEPGLSSTVAGHTAQLADIAINVKRPPASLEAAKGDGTTNDTAAINAIVAYVKANKLGGIYFPDSSGFYMIQGVDMTDVDTTTRNKYGGILIDAPMRIVLHPNAVLKQITTDQQGYAILNIHDTHHVTVEGGTILGDRLTHTGVGGEQGHGIKIMTSHDITIRGVEIRDCWGDGIITAYNNAPYDQNYNINIYNVVSKNNRRCGLAVVDGRDFNIVDCEFSDTNGTSPACGIDFESDGIALPIRNMFVNGNRFFNNTEHGVVLGGGNGCYDFKINENLFDENDIGITAIGTLANPIIGLDISNNTIRINGGGNGILTRYVDKVNIVENDIYDNADTKTAKGILVDVNCNNLMIDNNDLFWLDFGIYYQDSTTCRFVKIHRNTIVNTVKPIQGGGRDCEFVGNTCDVFSSDCSVYMQYGKFCDNKFSNSTIGAVYGTFAHCSISRNHFSDISNGNKANSMMLFGEMNNCFIEGNYFNSSSSQPAITELNPHTIASVVTNNHAKSAAVGVSFSLQVGTVLGTNFTA